MRIFVDGYLLNKEFQGTRTYITELYKSLALLRKEWIIEFGVNDLTQDIIEEFKDYQNIKFIIFKEKNKWKRMFKEYGELSYNYDYMHFQYIIPFIKRNKKCKIVNTIHDVLFLDYPEGFPLIYRLSRKILFKWSAKNSDILLTVSEYSKTKISEHFKINLNQIFITPNGVNSAYLEEYNKEEVKELVYNSYQIKDYILYVSRIEPRKNQLKLLELYAENPEVYKKYKLVLIGKKSLDFIAFNKYYDSLDLDIKSNILYFEQVNNKDLINIYRGADYFVYPSLYEGFGIPPIEAAAAKVPVLSHNKTAMADFVMLNPYLVDFQKENITDLFKDFILENKSNLEGVKQEVASKFTWENSAKRLEDYYKN
jgi:glycosyltransferase involved in cell wall biosynthesis